MSDDFITRYYEGEMCPECGEDEGLVEVEDDDESYLECKKCGAISNNAKTRRGAWFRMTDFVITLEKLRCYEGTGDIDEETRSRPLSSEFKKMDIRTHTRGCLTCRSPTCPVWQAADQNCWVSEKEWLSSELKKERDDVCNEAIRAIKVIGMPFGTEALFIQTIESLRSEQP